MPNVTLDPREVQIWLQLKEKNITNEQGFQNLFELRHSRTVLSQRSLDLLALTDPAALNAFVDSYKNVPLIQQVQQSYPIFASKFQTVTTCMKAIKKRRDEDNAQGCLVVGTEHSQLFILESNGAGIMKKVRPTPSF
jgi:hypothetical protein